MPDTRPIEDRFDVTYVHRSHGPDRVNRLLMWLVVLASGALLATLAVRGDNRVYSSGSLSTVHASFGNDCMQCHQPEVNGSSSYFLPVAENACLRCHAAVEHSPNQSRFSAESQVTIPGHAGSVRMAGDCAACHVEHRGRHADLKIIPDRTCVECHGNLTLKGFAQRLEPAATNGESMTEAQP